MNKAYGYARVSTGRQAEIGTSLESQEKNINLYYHSKHSQEYEWGELFVDDGVSAFKKPLHRRPAGRDLLRVLQPGDLIIVSKVDRMFRAPYDFYNVRRTLDRTKVKLCIIDFMGGGTVDGTTPMGELLLGFMVLCAQFESHMRAERARESHAIRKARGDSYAFNVGKRRDENTGKLKHDPDYKRYAIQAVELKDQGYEIGEIAKILEKRWREEKKKKPSIHKQWDYHRTYKALKRGYHFREAESADGDGQQQRALLPDHTARKARTEHGPAGPSVPSPLF
jgi:DNA invertase Pin-like site-specific DNA recombinase